MKRHLIIRTLVCCTLFVCLSCKSDKNKGQTGYFAFKGQMGDNSPLTFHLLLSHQGVMGYYFYDVVGIPFYLRGRLDKDSLFLEEYDAFQQVRATFRGIWDRAAYLIEGDWRDEKIKKSFQLSLEANEGAVPLTYEYAEYTPVFSEDSSDKAHIALHISKINNSRVSVSSASWINLKIAKEILRLPYFNVAFKDKNALFASRLLEEWDIYSIDIAALPVRNTASLLSVALTHRLCMTNSSKPLQMTYFHNYNLNTGRIWKIRDFFKDEASFNYLVQELRAMFQRTYQMPFPDLQEDWYDNFIITHSGFYFLIQEENLVKRKVLTYSIFVPFDHFANRILPLFFNYSE